MKRINATLSLAASALLSLLFCNSVYAQGPDNVEGDWTIYATSIKDGSTEVKHVQIQQYGNAITGYFEGPFQAGPIQGEVDGHHVRFDTVTRTVLHFRGQIFGNSMSGSCGIRGKHGPWQAVRTSGGPEVIAPPAPTMNYSQPVVAAPPTEYAAPQYAAPQYTAPQPMPEYSAPTPAPAPQYAAPQATAPQSAAPSSPAPVAAVLTPDQLNSLVAPIALYPDGLVAQVLAAATFPDQVAVANYWLQQNSSLSGDALAKAVDQQSWDPSVKGLTQFPAILDNLAKNLSWTSSLGQAFHNQQSDVMAAVQVMRAKAQAAGTLQSSSQITVTQQAPGVIVIQPANPQIVYVPQYNPAVVYGGAVVVPFYNPPVGFVGASLSFGAGISIGGFVGGGVGFVGGGFGWGWHAWGCNWGGGGGGNTIIYNHTTYIHNNTWNNNTYNHYHGWGPGPHGDGPNSPHPYDPNYHPGTDTHYGPNGGYHPNGYYGPDGHFHHDVPGSGDVPHAGDNGNHGLIGGPGANESKEAREQDRGRSQENMSRSRMAGDGHSSRAESYRGHSSMSHEHSAHMAHAHAPAAHHSSGGGRRR